jgi:NAD(P)-dependent dehydrogenase (short-subunit alcohol dehydrogenase family)
VKDLAGKCAVVTGGAHGIGRATALALAARGVSVAIVDLDEEAGEAAARDMQGSGHEAIFLRFDVAKDDFTGLKTAVLDRLGRIDIVMNNVGVLTQGAPDAIPVSEWQRIIDINLMSIVRANEVFLPHLIAQGAGHIVNTASFAGLYTYSCDRLPYAACKAAIVQMTEGLALYLRPRGIGVTLLCPGPVATRIGESIRTFGPAPEMHGPGAQFGLRQADEVGELVVRAILDDTFFVSTHPEVRELLMRRAADWDGFLLDRQENPHVISQGGTPPTSKEGE